MIGVDDPHFYGCDDLEEALEAVPEDDFKVLLAHTPEIFEKAARSGIHLYLCGHTHAGQIRLPIIGEVLQNTDCPKSLCAGRVATRSDAGAYERIGGLLGCSGPIQLSRLGGMTHLCSPKTILA